MSLEATDSRYREESTKQDGDSAECDKGLHRCEDTNAAEDPVIRFVVLASKHHQGEFEFSARSPAMMEPLDEILSVGTHHPPVGGALDGNHDDAENQDNRKDDDPRCGRELRRHRDRDGSRCQKYRQDSAGKAQ